MCFVYQNVSYLIPAHPLHYRVRFVHIYYITTNSGSDKKLETLDEDFIKELAGDNDKEEQKKAEEAAAKARKAKNKLEMRLQQEAKAAKSGKRNKNKGAAADDDDDEPLEAFVKGSTKKKR